MTAPKVEGREKELERFLNALAGAMEASRGKRVHANPSQIRVRRMQVDRFFLKPVDIRLAVNDDRFHLPYGSGMVCRWRVGEVLHPVFAGPLLQIGVAKWRQYQHDN